MSEKHWPDADADKQALLEEVYFGGEDAPTQINDEGGYITKDGFRFDVGMKEIVTPTDPVNHPPHYKQFGVEVIDIIRHVLGAEGFRAYCIGNELKYSLRAGDKGDAAQDLAKAQKYREFREGK